MKLLQLNRQLKFTNSLEKLINKIDEVNDQLLTRQIIYPLDLNDPILRLLLLPYSKALNVLKLTILLLISQDKSLTLSGKKQTIIQKMFNHRLKSLATKSRLKIEGPILSLQTLSYPSFLEDSCFILYKKIGEISYPSILSILSGYILNDSSFNPEISTYWENYNYETLKTTALLAFSLICKESYSLNFIWVKPVTAREAKL